VAKQTKKKEGELQRAEPGRMLTPFDEMERLFGGFLPRGWMRRFGADWPSWGEMTAFEGRMPRVDVIDRDDEVVVRAEVPGVAKDALDVSVSDNSVTIKGETKREEKEEKGDYHRCEISRGSFARTISLADYVDAEKAKATFKDGVLELTLPKVEKAKRRTIEID
jgi:HSP20 family protein